MEAKTNTPFLLSPAASLHLQGIHARRGRTRTPRCEPGDDRSRPAGRGRAPGGPRDRAPSAGVPASASLVPARPGSGDSQCQSCVPAPPFPGRSSSHAALPPPPLNARKAPEETPARKARPLLFPIWASPGARRKANASFPPPYWGSETRIRGWRPLTSGPARRCLRLRRALTSDSRCEHRPHSRGNFRLLALQAPPLRAGARPLHSRPHPRAGSGGGARAGKALVEEPSGRACWGEPKTPRENNCAASFGESSLRDFLAEPGKGLPAVCVAMDAYLSPETLNWTAVALAKNRREFWINPIYASSRLLPVFLERALYVPRSAVPEVCLSRRWKLVTLNIQKLKRVTTPEDSDKQQQPKVVQHYYPQLIFLSPNQ